MKNREFLELEDVKIEFDDRLTHEVYFESHLFFAPIGLGTSVLVQFIPLITNEQALPTFTDGGRARIDGEVYIVLDHRWGTRPISVYGHEPPFDPIMMGVYTHRLHSLSDVDDPFPETVWRDVPGMAYKIPADDPQLRQVAHSRHIAITLKNEVETINGLIKEGSSHPDLADGIADVQKLVAYNLKVMLKNITREHIRGV